MSGRSTSRRSTRSSCRCRSWAQGGPLPLDPHVLVRADVLRAARGAVAGAAAAAIWPGTYSSAALAGAEVEPFVTFDEAAAVLGTRAGLTYLYWDAIDAAGHRYGPSSPEFDAAALAALDALDRVRDTLLVVTADHGQIDVGSEIDYLDEIWPRCSSTLRFGPAGSARDCFLHVDDPGLVVGELAQRLGERAEVAACGRPLPRRRPAPAAPGSPTSACCPHRAGWRGCRPTRRSSCASRATTAAAPRRSLRRGSACSRHDAWMESGVSFAALDTDTEERFVPLRRMLGSRASASTRSSCARDSAAASTATARRRRSTSSWRARSRS